MVDYERKWFYFSCKGICGRKANNRKKFEFLCNSTVYWRRMVKSIYLIKHRFIKAVLFLDVIENR